MNRQERTQGEGLGGGNVPANRNDPRPYDLSDREEVRRLVREVRGYIHVCRFHGGDFDGRRYAIEALEKLSGPLFDIDVWEREPVDPPPTART